MIWAIPFQVIVGILMAAAYAAGIWVLMAVSRSENLIYLPNAIRFAFAMFASWVGLLWARQQIRLPSLRLLQASITIGFLAYVLSPVLTFHALRVLPSGLVSLAFAFVPLFAMLGYRQADGRVPYFFLALGILVAFTVGVQSEAVLRGKVWSSLVILIGGVLTYVVSVWLWRRVFSLHNSWHVSFWASASATLILLLMGAGAGESAQQFLHLPKIYWVYLSVSGLLFTGFGILGYRATAFRMGPVGKAVWSASIPVFGIAFGYLSWGETPVNLVTGISLLMGCFALAIAGYRSERSIWMCHFHYQDLRIGDRHGLILNGFLRVGNSEMTRVRVVDLSVGGLGVQAEHNLAVAENAILEVVLAEGNQITIECRVVHVRPSKDKDFPFNGGLAWLPMPASRIEDMVEFLVKMGRPADI